MIPAITSQTGGIRFARRTAPLCQIYGVSSDPR
jgi:hypothetical protein